MNSNKLANWLQIGANIGILAGLILVGFQMQQNTDLLELQLIESGTQRTNDWFNHKMGEEFAQVWEKHMLEPENMTLRELYIVDQYYQSLIVGWLDAYRLAESGLVDAGDWRWEIQVSASAYFNNRFGSAYLAEAQLSGLLKDAPDPIIQEIQQALANDESLGSQDFLRRVQNRIGAPK